MAWRSCLELQAEFFRYERLGSWTSAAHEGCVWDLGIVLKRNGAIWRKQRDCLQPKAVSGPSYSEVTVTRLVVRKRKLIVSSGREGFIVIGGTELKGKFPVHTRCRLGIDQTMKSR